jgi:hypothetical protein
MPVPVSLTPVINLTLVSAALAANQPPALTTQVFNNEKQYQHVYT